MTDKISISGEFFWTANHNFARKDFAENGVFYCASYPIHWPFLMMGFFVVSFQAYLGVDQSEQFKHEFGPKLWSTTNEFWYSNGCSEMNAVEWLLHIYSTINHQSRIRVAGHLGSTNMAEIYGYVLREIKVCWTYFLKISSLIISSLPCLTHHFCQLLP